ncbi:MAG TPA: hypothetical protein VMA97_08260, partial [Streptosporangiaceae bacterium]|nr:hypothetical protein [Streptosporangiaceae bacterium]
AWGCTMVFTAMRHSKLRDELVRIEQMARREIQHWKDEAARARTHAAQLARDKETWAAGRKQGRDDVIGVVPLLIAAQDHGTGGTCGQHGAQEITENA